MNPLDYLKAGAAAAVVMLALFAWGAWERGSAAKAELATFTESTKAAGEQAIQRNKGVNDANKKRQAATVASRDTALRCLHNDACAGRSTVPLVPPAAGGDSTICYRQTALSAAVENYRTAVQRRVTEGDAAQIDAKGLLSAWPSAD